MVREYIFTGRRHRIRQKEEGIFAIEERRAEAGRETWVTREQVFKPIQSGPSLCGAFHELLDCMSRRGIRLHDGETDC